MSLEITYTTASCLEFLHILVFSWKPLNTFSYSVF